MSDLRYLALVTRALELFKRRAVFLWVAFALPAAATFGHALAPGRPFFKGQDAGIIVGLVALTFVVVMWIPFSGGRRWPATVYLFLGLLGAAWLYQILRTQLDQSVFNLTVVAVPVLLVIVAIKSVSRRDLDVGLLVLAYSLIAISLASLVLGAAHWMPDGFLATDSGPNRLIPTQWIGIETRWGGPFGSVNYASPIGGLLGTIGITRVGLNRWIITFSGLVVLALGQARTTMFALVAALLVVVLWSPLVSRLKHANVWRIGVIGGAAATGVAYVVTQDPTLALRTPVWDDFGQLWLANPVSGVGTSGILDFVAAMNGSPGFVPHTHAHSVLLDGAVRFGLLSAVLAIGVFTIALVVSARGLRSRGVGPFAVTVFVVTAGLTETIHSWIYWTPYLAAILWAVLMTQSPQEAPQKSLVDKESR